MKAAHALDILCMRSVSIGFPRPPDDPPNTAEWHSWRHGFESEYGERVPMTDAEVRAAFEALNAGRYSH